MHMRHEDSDKFGETDLGWLIRCTSGCEGLVHRDPPLIGDFCPLCDDGQQKTGSITERIKIMPAAERSEQMSLEGGIFVEGDEFRPWNVDLGSFLKGAIADSSDITFVGDLNGESLGSGIFAEKLETTPDRKSPLRSQVKSLDSTTESKGPLGSVDQPQVAVKASESVDLLDASEDILFTKWHVVGLLCCVVLLLVGGLLTFDIVRYLYSPGDTSIASPILRVLR